MKSSAPSGIQTRDDGSLNRGMSVCNNAICDTDIT